MARAVASTSAAGARARRRSPRVCVDVATVALDDALRASTQNSMSALASSPRSLAERAGKVAAVAGRARASVVEPAPAAAAAAELVERAVELGGVTRCVRRSSGRRASASRASARLSPTPARDRDASAGIAAPFRAGIGERDQMAREIAAVDRRDVGRLERPQIARVVPVEEVAVEALQPLHGRQRRLEPLDVSSVPIQPKSRAATVDSR